MACFCSATWQDLFVNEAANKKWKPNVCAKEKMVSAKERGIPVVFWKKLLFSKMGFHEDFDWKKDLQHMNPYTGMPQQTEQVLRSDFYVRSFFNCCKVVANI